MLSHNRGHRLASGQCPLLGAATYCAWLAPPHGEVSVVQQHRGAESLYEFLPTRAECNKDCKLNLLCHPSFNCGELGIAAMATVARTYVSPIIAHCHASNMVIVFLDCMLGEPQIASLCHLNPYCNQGTLTITNTAR